MMAANRVMLSIRAKGNCRKHRGLVITARPRANRVNREKDVKSLGQQVERRLLHADVSFDSNQEHVIDPLVAKWSEQCRAFAAAEHRLLRRFRQPLAQLGNRGSQPFRILLGRERPDPQQLGRVEQPSNVPDDAAVVRNQGEQFLLNINDQQG